MFILCIIIWTLKTKTTLYNATQLRLILHSRHFQTNKTKLLIKTKTKRVRHCHKRNSYIMSALISLFALCYGTLLLVKEAAAAPHNENINRREWPPMKYHDIWSVDLNETHNNEAHVNDATSFTKDQLEFVAQKLEETWSFKPRRNRVIHFLPVPVDGECLSDDGRRTGTCHNAYECRQKGGTAKGECAMGFGVCCIFIVNCSTEDVISNNITYLVSQNFPSLMPYNLTACKLKVKLMSTEVSQLRIDFFHFSMGQPNRRTGVCDGDLFQISGGPAGNFSLCGQNSGQHMYYDVGDQPLARQQLFGSLRPQTFAEVYPNFNSSSNAEPDIEINMQFTQRFLPQRIWEIRIMQIPFSQRAPPGCLQYHTEPTGVMQTFNFADNGRHLANQNYKICVRQATNMCSIMYEPCDEQSFRIGPLAMKLAAPPMHMAGNALSGMPATVTGATIAPQMATVANPSVASPVVSMPSMSMGSMLSNLASTMASMLNMGTQTTPMSATMSASTMSTQSSAAGNLRNSTVTQSTTPSTPDTPTTPNTPNTPATTAAMSSTAASTSAMPSSTTSTTTTTTTTTSTTTTAAPLNDDLDDGSGDGGGDAVTPSAAAGVTSRRPAAGGFDLFGFFRNAFDLNIRKNRQLMSSCRDRITMPCIIEDFINTGLGPLPGCEPVHCGGQFCSSGISPCRIESTVTPFYIGIHFGEGTNKGSAEDNIGACLRYTQIQCS